MNGLYAGLIYRYIAWTVFKSLLFVLVALIFLTWFILSLGEFEAIGRAGYTLNKALFFSATQVFHILDALFPVIVLLGALLGLGSLSDHGELILCRVSGLSVVSLAILLSCFAVLVLTIWSVFGEIMGYPLSDFGKQRKEMALRTAEHQPNSQANSRSGLWLRHENNFIFIRKISPDARVLEDFNQYSVNQDWTFSTVLHAKKVEFIQDKRWRLQDVTVKDLTQHGQSDKPTQAIAIHHHQDSTVNLGFSKNFLLLKQTSPDSLSYRGLYRLIRFSLQEHQHLSPSYQFAFWQKVFRPLIAVIMVCLALPFVLGLSRTEHQRSRLISGIGLGIVFYFFQQMIGPFCLLIRMPPSLAASLPCIVFGTWAFFRLKR